MSTETRGDFPGWVEPPSHLEAHCHEWHDLVRDFGDARPEIVVLLGSTRFYDAFQQANYDLTMAGKIVLSVGFYPHAYWDEDWTACPTAARAVAVARVILGEAADA